MCITMCALNCCCLCLACLSTLLMLFGALLVPQVHTEFYRLSASHLDGTPLFMAGLVTLGRHFTYCLGDYLGCVKDEAAHDLTATFTWETGVGLMPALGPSMMFHGQRMVSVRFSHKEYRRAAYDPHAGRPVDMMVASNKSSLPAGVLPDLSPDILLNFDTGSKEHSDRRHLLADALPALKWDAELPAFQIPPGVKPGDASNKRSVFDVVGYNLFRCLFEADLASELASLFEYDATFTPAVLGAPLLGFQGRRLAEIRSTVFQKVEAGEVGKSFMALATERSMYGKQRLDEMVWIALFAGYGGTGNLAYETLRMILKDPSMIKLFRRDPDAFMLEAARVRPPVGGMNPYQFREPQEIPLPSAGRTWTARAGDLAFMLTSAANNDPLIFKDPSAFIPGRENAERLLSWNNEWGDFKSCPSVAGCPAAPRGCPGTFLSMHLAKNAVAFFIEGMEAKLKSPQSEL
ncbi:unnamed protein product [Effrenium voratum]|nr:unnamed protein product [Effrenium voratum]|mmetsp:Transcript_13538/g.32151  ORF Transcript_13538/g.32151 Transcript_13538/m.32151 type:complete len:462 (-) Transcript_13538:207-1592(-)